ncbi:MAG: HipA domain-containing protein [Verrucomicrobiae bacterium]|nr:HipA domain-containing protein [Verrucomicrobiae bacterium]
MNGEKVGLWHAGGQNGHPFIYEDSWRQSEHARPISLSMPLRVSREPYRKGVEAFFDNLLPDNRSIRERIQHRYRTRSARAFDLLAEIGRDCVGALQLLPEEAEPAGIRSIHGQRLSRKQVADELSRCLGQASAAPGQDDEFRISLAGAQEKTALLWHDGAWHRPTGATPTTHILKLPIGPAPMGINLSTSVENEWLCGRILSAFGIPVADSRMERFGEYRVLVIERFDRRPAQDRSWWMRLPQEDLCQATATPPACKYESDGGPGILPIMELLRGSNQPIADREDFLRTQLVFWLLAAIDGHAKNMGLPVAPLSGFPWVISPDEADIQHPSR